jgi:hypothetical protein
MKKLLGNLKPYYSSKISIIIFSIQATFFLKDAREFTQALFRNEEYVLIALILMILLFGFHFFQDRRRLQDIEKSDLNHDYREKLDDEKSDPKEQDHNKNPQACKTQKSEFSDSLSQVRIHAESEHQENTQCFYTNAFEQVEGDSIIKLEKTRQDIHSKGNVPNYRLISKVLFVSIVSMIIFIALSMVTLYLSDIHYVVLRNHILDRNEAYDFTNMANEALTMEGLQEYRATCLKKGDGENYMVTINGGFISEDQANRVLDKLKRISEDGVINPELKTSNAQFLRKLKYLKKDFTPD